jgi:hypothetical protein
MAERYALVAQPGPCVLWVSRGRHTSGDCALGQQRQAHNWRLCSGSAEAGTHLATVWRMHSTTTPLIEEEQQSIVMTTAAAAAAAAAECQACRAPHLVQHVELLV